MRAVLIVCLLFAIASTTFCCECKYLPDHYGCAISKYAPENFACWCSTLRDNTCRATLVNCNGLKSCINPETKKKTCWLEDGGCGGGAN